MQAVYLPNKNTIILNVYRPFGDLNIFFAMLEETLEQFAESHPNSDLIIVGDFNIDLQRSSSITNRLIELTILNDLVQHVTIPTRISVNHRSIIDHVYIRSRRIMQTDVIMTAISDHFATITKIQDFKRDSPKNKVTKRWFTPETFEYLRILLRHENWTPMRDLNCAEATDFLIDKITKALDLLAPVETKELKSYSSNSWITQGIKISLQTQNSLLVKLNRINNQVNTSKYKTYKNILTKVIRKTKALETENTIEEAGNDSRKLWGIMNEIVDRKQQKHKIPGRFNKIMANLS